MRYKLEVKPDGRELLHDLENGNIMWTNTPNKSWFFLGETADDCIDDMAYWKKNNVRRLNWLQGEGVVIDLSHD